MTARSPWLPTSAADGLTLKSPLSVTAADQAESEPDSKPSAKITSADIVGVGVLVIVEVAVGVRLEVGVAVGVRVWVAVGVNVLVGV